MKPLTYHTLGIITLICWLSNTGDALAQDLKQQFERLDKNQDQTLSAAELPPKMRANFARVDANGDGAISFAEHRRFVQRGRLPDYAQAQLDIAYVVDGHERQKLDLYLPIDSEAKSHPLVIWIHGGGWRNGNRFPCPALFLCQHGYAVASVGYRLTDAAIFPAQIEDCKAAIGFLRAEAAKYRLDADRFGVWGSSAGGHLSALVGTSGNAKALNQHSESTSSQVQAVCDYYGPTDLLQMDAQSGANSRMTHNASDSPESKLLGGPLQQQVELATAANPLTYIDPADPPFLIVHGDQDPLVPHQQSRLLNNALKAAGVPSRLIIVPGGGHGPFREPEQLQQVQAFFDSLLKAQ